MTDIAKAQEELIKLKDALWAKTVETATARVKLEGIRKDRNLDPEVVSDAAYAHRAAEAAMYSLLNELLEAQARILNLATEEGR